MNPPPVTPMQSVPKPGVTPEKREPSPGDRMTPQKPQLATPVKNHGVRITPSSPAVMANPQPQMRGLMMSPMPQRPQTPQVTPQKMQTPPPNQKGALSVRYTPERPEDDGDISRKARNVVRGARDAVRNVVQPVRNVFNDFENFVLGDAFPDFPPQAPVAVMTTLPPPPPKAPVNIQQSPIVQKTPPPAAQKSQILMAQMQSPIKKNIEKPADEAAKNATCVVNVSMMLQNQIELNGNNSAAKAAVDAFVTKYSTLGVVAMVKEWEDKIRKYSPPNMKRTSFEAHPTCNRYKDMPCVEDTRVVLRYGKGRDYIHANYVEGDPFYNRLLCTQAPLPITVHDFWRMVVQERVSNIVMLCDVMEKGKKKCETYWPSHPGNVVTVGDIKVKHMGVITLDSTIPAGEGIICNLEVTAPDGIRLMVKHYKYVGWPDHHVPKNNLTILRILNCLRIMSSTSIVHCSAGVGRTGTFVAIEMLQIELLSYCKPNIDLAELVQRLRAMRMTSVQTALQYAYIVVVIGDYALANNMLSPNAIKLYKKYHADFGVAMQLNAAA